MKMIMKLPCLSIFIFTFMMLSGCSNGITVLDPEGPVAKEQYELIMLSIVLMLLIVLVVFVAFTMIVIRYRDREGHRGHDPEQEGHRWLEVVWTVIPVIIVTILAIPTVRTIYDLEDLPEESKHQEPLVIRVVSSDWKWIFTYPEQNIETVNYVNIPADVPVKFKLTSAESMTSFWVPALGGQKYAMAGMETELILEASEPGTYEGRNANFNGKGFTHMKFQVHALQKDAFQQWVKKVQRTAPKLTEQKYISILEPGLVKKMTFSSTHLKYVNHVQNPTYALRHTGERLEHPVKSKEKDEVTRPSGHHH